MAHILITGIAGGLAQLVASKLLAEGHQVVGVDYRDLRTPLDPSLQIVAPTRENAMAREYQIEYLKEHGVDIPWGEKGPFSIDENMWGRSAEAGVLEDPWTEPPAESYEWTVDAEQAPGLRRDGRTPWRPSTAAPKPSGDGSSRLSICSSESIS